MMTVKQGFFSLRGSLLFFAILTLLSLTYLSLKYSTPTQVTKLSIENLNNVLVNEKEGDHVSVEPGLCHRAILGDGADHVVGDCEEEGGVAVEEAAGDGGVNVFEAGGSCVEVAKPGGNALRGGGQVLQGGSGGGGRERKWDGCYGFEAVLSVPELVSKEGGLETFCGIFIRAPTILEAGPEVQEVAAEVVQKLQPREASTVFIEEEGVLEWKEAQALKSKKEEVVAMRESFLEINRLREGEGVLGNSERVKGSTQSSENSHTM
ncbi:hypothetical protein JHK87_016313 [Glycine soja]|nr:hypothetical protein JHK87_016313 [Glycine soja]